MDYFTQLALSLSQYPALQGLLAALGTLILEDPTTVGCGLLVADGAMSYWAAFTGLSLGISLGDFGLYLIGRLAQNKVVKWGLLDESRFAHACAWFNRNVVLAVLSSRFLPGARLPTYVAAGILKVSPLKFLATAVAASLLWTATLLWLTIQVGKDLLDRAGVWKWPIGLGILALIIAGQWVAASRRRAAAAADEKSRPAGPPAVSVFELWPAGLFMLPVAVYYAWLSLRYWGPSLPTAANPLIHGGGMVGESKSRILDLLPPHTRPFAAPWTVFLRPPGDADPDDMLKEAKKALERAGLDYPLVAKPDVGQRGAGVRRARNDRELLDYLKRFPAGEKLMLQKLAPHEAEAGIFWFRLPGRERGRIFSITEKIAPAVCGDGSSTLAELIQKDRRARHFSKVYFERHRERLDEVLPEGRRMPLVFCGNHCQGSRFKNGQRLASPQLERVIEEIASSIPEFHFGRMDLRYQSEEALREGRDFLIVEINGAAAEATHIWDPATTLRQAYAALFRQFRVAFIIGAANRRRGFKPMPTWRLLAEWARYRKLAALYPPCE